MIAGQSLTVQPFIRPYKTSPQVTHRPARGALVGGAVSSTYPLFSREHATHNSARRMTLIHDFLIAIYTAQRLITLWRLCRAGARADKAGLQDRSAATHPPTTSYPRAAPLEAHHNPATAKMAAMKHSLEQWRIRLFYSWFIISFVKTRVKFEPLGEFDILLSDIKK